MTSEHSKNFILLFFTAIIWGVAFVAQSVGMDHVGPFTFNAIRSLLGGIVLIPCIFIFRRPKSSEEGEKTMDRPKDLIIGGGLCGLMLFISTTLQQVGIQYTTVAKAGFITALYIVLVPVLGIFIRKKVGLKVWASVVIALAGLYLLCMKGSFTLGKGDLLVLLCSLCFALHILVIDHFTQRTSGVKLSCIQFFITGFLSSLLMFLFETPTWADILAAWVPLFYAGVFSSGVAYTFQIIGQRGTDPTVASLILSLESVVSVLAGWLLLGQSLRPREILGCVLMFGAILLAQISPAKDKIPQPEEQTS